MRLPLRVLAVLLLGPAIASAEVVVKGIQWQISPRGRGQPRAFHSVSRWIEAPSARLSAKPRALVTLENPTAKEIDGLVLRYALSAKVQRLDGTGEGVWTVPFWLESRRVARVKANETRQVPIDYLLLDAHLKKLFNAGFWPEALKIQVMLEPRKGEGLDGRLAEQELPVAKKP